ncbi:MAG: cysteine--tRNA ligase [Defluviitaleaceae bacterium]|nr:cysteine--tRNA ligase [Defluviitaleaceae bacterium]
MKIYNTLTNRKEEFVPIEENKIKMYVCGPTVYNFIHIGNARPYVVFDTFRRYMQFKGYDVSFVQNFTDVDDRIINKAKEENVSMDVISNRYIDEVNKDAKGLNVLPATHNPRVTEEIPEIIEMVKDLIEKGYAYEKNGSVYFSTEGFADYGKLSNRKLEDMESGQRIEIDEEKQSPMDFILWKPKNDKEYTWESPWGNGRPGWHIECSVMAKKYLGETIDIHAGGEDLVFPHHENEIAQSEAVNGKPFANYWMHNAFLNIDNQKMSKSKGNFFTLREVSEQFSYEVIRFFLLSGHYRSRINFTHDILKAAETSLTRIKTSLANLKFIYENSNVLNMTEEENKFLLESKKFEDDFIKSMEDDLNTADAISAIFEFVRFANSNVNENSSKEFAKNIYDNMFKLCDILGMEELKEDNETDKEIEGLIAKRQEAKKSKDFAKADSIRNQLLEMGITIEDTRAGVRWHRL